MTSCRLDGDGQEPLPKKKDQGGQQAPAQWEVARLPDSRSTRALSSLLPPKLERVLQLVAENAFGRRGCSTFDAEIESEKRNSRRFSTKVT